jgi:hypothetical protein
MQCSTLHVYKALDHACHDLTIKAGHILEPDQNDEALSLSLIKREIHFELQVSHHQQQQQSSYSSPSSSRYV